MPLHGEFAFRLALRNKARHSDGEERPRRNRPAMSFVPGPILEAQSMPSYYQDLFGERFDSASSDEGDRVASEASPAARLAAGTNPRAAVHGFLKGVV